MSKFAWVTLSTNDTYSLGALVLAYSLKKVNTIYPMAIMVTPNVSMAMRDCLKRVFQLIQDVNIMDSKDIDNLALLQRPELGITFTKLHCWHLIQYEKCVFLDADTLVLQNCDELFDNAELSAAPDVSWPDCFNSGVFVYQPNLNTFVNLIKYALKYGSFDGGDQGILNQYFNNCSSTNSSNNSQWHRLSFLYNVTAYATYCYMPAFRKFRNQIKIIHFAGKQKPWLMSDNLQYKSINIPLEYQHATEFIQFWWHLFNYHIYPQLNKQMTLRLQMMHEFSNYMPQQHHHQQQPNKQNVYSKYYRKVKRKTHETKTHEDNMYDENNDNNGENVNLNDNNNDNHNDNHNDNNNDNANENKFRSIMENDFNNVQEKFIRTHQHRQQLHQQQYTPHYEHFRKDDAIEKQTKQKDQRSETEEAKETEAEAVYRNLNITTILGEKNVANKRFSSSPLFPTSSTFSLTANSKQLQKSYDIEEQQKQQHHHQQQQQQNQKKDEEMFKTDQFTKRQINVEFNTNESTTTQATTTNPIIVNTNENVETSATENNAINHPIFLFNDKIAKHDNAQQMNVNIEQNVNEEEKQVEEEEAYDNADIKKYNNNNDDVNENCRSESGLAERLTQMNLDDVTSINEQTIESKELDLTRRRQCWEAGYIDYAGVDSFDNIWQHIQKTLQQQSESDKTPTIES